MGLRISDLKETIRAALHRYSLPSGVLRAFKKDGWRPIAQAPRDGTVIHLRNDKGEFVGRWWYHSWGADWASLAFNEEPTEWRPYPEWKQETRSLGSRAHADGWANGRITRD